MNEPWNVAKASENDVDQQMRAAPELPVHTKRREEIGADAGDKISHFRGTAISGGETWERVSDKEEVRSR